MSLTQQILDLATRIGTEIKGKEPKITTKKTAFNVDFGTASGTACQGNDSRLADVRTPSDASVSYTKVASDLVSRQAVSASAIDWSSGAVFTKTLSGTTTFTFSNVQLNKVITLIVTGAYTFSIPVTAANIQGTANIAKTNKIQIHCTNATSGSEEYWAVITTN